MSRTLIVTSTSYVIRAKPKGLPRTIPFEEHNPRSREEYDAKLAELQTGKVKILEHFATDHYKSIGTDDLGVIVACREDGTPLFARTLAADTWDKLADKVDRDISTTFLCRKDVAYFDVYNVVMSGMELKERRERTSNEES